MTQDWVHPAGALARGPWQVVVDAEIDGWQYTGLKVGTIGGDASLSLDDAGLESILLPLSGSFDVAWTSADGTSGVQHLDGRRDVIDEVTDVFYVGLGGTATITGSGRIAVAQAVATDTLPATYLAAADVPVLVRGSGRLSREVRNFGMAGVLAASKILACEVITPGGNWSSYPAHKHDEEVDGVETALEEIYYFEVRSDVERGGGAPYALFSTRGSGGRDLQIDARVGDGDVVLVPFGFHGPLAVPPASTLYQLNVMAGAGERAWRAVNEEGADAITAIVDAEGVDARLPRRAVFV